jgi:hypothetical protein
VKVSSIIAGFCSLAVSPAYGQLYLLQGNPSPKTAGGGYSMALLEASSDGSIRSVAQVLPGGGEGGTEWIGVSHDARKAVFFSKRPNHRIVVVDFDSASVVKSCESPVPPPGMSDFPFEEWLADAPGIGLVYVESFGTTDQKRLETGRLTGDDYALLGMTVDQSVPCDKSFRPMRAGEAALPIVGGTVGVADQGSWDAVYVGTDADGALWRGWFGGEHSYLGYRIPVEILGAGPRPSASIAINNAQALGVALRDSAGRWQLAVLRKDDSTWRALPGLRATAPFVRGFGSFVAVADTAPRAVGNSESAGQAEWRKTEVAAGPSIEERFKDLPYVLPGKLDLYDVATEKLYHIDTNQGDSEILLVDNGTVYYRVSDRLYSATIGTDGLEPAKLLSTSESIRDVHWAFIKH